MNLTAGDYARVLDLPASDLRTEKYLKGETLLLREEEVKEGPGWYLVCTDGYALGWGKVSGNLLKNKSQQANFLKNQLLYGLSLLVALLL